MTRTAPSGFSERMTDEIAMQVLARHGISLQGLDGDTMLSDSQEFNEIEGVVDITSPNESIGARSFPVNVAAYSVDQVVPEGYVAVAPTEGVFYEVMINGFADEVAKQVGNLNTAGSGVSK